MNAITTGLLPVILLIALGFSLRRSGFFPEASWPPLERITYFLLLPALLFHALAIADLRDAPVLAMGGAILATILLTTAALIALRPRVAANGPAFASLIQGSIRFNTFVGVSVTAGVYGAPGLALAPVAIAVIVPTVNAISVIVHERFARDGHTSLSRQIKATASNPLVIACALGALVNVAGIGLPGPVLSVLKSLGDAGLPIGLMAVGAALRLDRLAVPAGAGLTRWQGPLRPLLLSTVIRLILAPILATSIAFAFGIEGLALAVTVLFQSLPTASAAYVLARILGGDAPLMAAMITVQTLAALVTLPVVLALLALL